MELSGGEFQLFLFTGSSRRCASSQREHAVDLSIEIPQTQGVHGISTSELDRAQEEYHF
jgi:hypothetical protein